MQDIKLVDGDMVLDYVKGNDEIVQSAEIILGTRKGEFPFDMSMGLNRTNLLGKKYSEQLAAADVYEAMSQEERLTNVSVTPTINDRERTMTLHVTANTTQGESISEEVEYAR